MPATLNHDPSNKRIILSLILLFAVTVTSIIGIIFYSITRANEEAYIAARDYVAAVVEDRLNQHEVLAKDYAYWDDTIENAYLSQDAEWINENIGEYLTDTYKITDLFVLNSNGEAVLSLKDGQIERPFKNLCQRNQLDIQHII